MSTKMIDQFMEMVRIDSESGEEAAMIEYVLAKTSEMGASATVDDYGNLIAKFPAKGCTSTSPLLLSCHADTVKPGKGIEPVIHEGVITSSGETILGADDKAGIAEVLQALRIAEIHPPIEFALSRQEEVGLLGVKNMNFDLIQSKHGFLLDNDSLDTIVIGGPSYFAIDVEVYGKAAHAGMEPEKGISAILAASKAICALRLGRLEQQATANVGIIEGGLIRNGVPDKTRFLAECRSSDHDRAQDLADEMVRTIHEQVESMGAKAKIQVDNLCKAVSIPADAVTVSIAQQAFKTVGIEAKPIFITGFTDASIYNNRGIEVAVVGIGAKNEHSCQESIAIADMEKALQALVEMLRLAATQL